MCTDDGGARAEDEGMLSRERECEPVGMREWEPAAGMREWVRERSHEPRNRARRHCAPHATPAAPVAAALHRHGGTTNWSGVPAGVYVLRRRRVGGLGVAGGVDMDANADMGLSSALPPKEASGCPKDAMGATRGRGGGGRKKAALS
jgi:hypothetical protein